MSIWHLKSYFISLSNDGANINSLQFDGIWTEFKDGAGSIVTRTKQVQFIDTITANGGQGGLHQGEQLTSIEEVKLSMGKPTRNIIQSNRENLLSLNFVRDLFPLGIDNFNNLHHNISSYNKTHFDDQRNYYNDRKGYGRMYLDSTFYAGIALPMLGNAFSATVGHKWAFRGAAVSGVASAFTDLKFSSQYENAIRSASKHPIIILDFYKEDDRNRDASGRIISAYRRNIIEKRDEKPVSDENILQTVFGTVSRYIDGYFKKAESIKNSGRFR